jgi:uncharacterized protein (DUF58 family)
VPPAPPSAPPVDLLQSASVLRRLELEIDRRLDGVITGDYLAWSAGPGTERTGARCYEPSDDARRIDWNLSARSLEPQVRTTQADRELETTIVVDRSASLDFGTARREKREVVLAVTAAFGILTARGGNRLHVLIAGGDELVRIPPRHDRRGVPRWPPSTARPVVKRHPARAPIWPLHSITPDVPASAVD